MSTPDGGSPNIPDGFITICSPGQPNRRIEFNTGRVRFIWRDGAVDFIDIRTATHDGTDDPRALRSKFQRTRSCNPEPFVLRDDDAMWCPDVAYSTHVFKLNSELAHYGPITVLETCYKEEGKWG